MKGMVMQSGLLVGGTFDEYKIEGLGGWVVRTAVGLMPTSQMGWCVRLRGWNIEYRHLLLSF